MKVAVGQALPSGPDARWHGREIPAGYAKVRVDEIVTGFHVMELDIAGPEDERTLGEVLGGVILWDKNYIKLPGLAPRTTPPPSRRRSPTPPAPSPTPPVPSPRRSPPNDDYDHHTTSPCRSPMPQPDPAKPCSPTPPPPPSKPKWKCAPPSLSSSKNRSPKRKLSPLPKVPHANSPKRSYDLTSEELDASCKASIEAWKRACAEKWKPEPRPIYTEKQINYCHFFADCPNQYTMHHKPDDYLRTLQKEEAKKSRSSKSASGSQSNKSSASVKRSDVPQLGQQAKQSIPALKVPSIPPLLQQQDVEEAKKWAIEWDIPLEVIVGSHDDKIPKAVVAPKPIFVRGRVWH